MLSGLNSQNFSLKTFLTFFPKKKTALKNFLIFPEMEPRTLNPPKILYISGNGTFQFTPRKFSHTSGN